MKQVARNLTMEEWGVLKPGQYLIHDGDKKFCEAFKHTLDEAGVNLRGRLIQIPASLRRLSARRISLVHDVRWPRSDLEP